MTYTTKDLYKRKDEVYVLKVGRYNVLEITKKDKRFYNGEYTFYKCIVFNKRDIVAAEGIYGSSLRTLSQAMKWGVERAIKLGIIKTI